MALFPRAGQSIRAHSLFFQAGQVRDKGIGVTSGMAVTRSSATAVAIASGNVRYGNAIVAYAGGSLETIPAASSGKHRYDAIVYDGPTAAVKRLAGSEATPDPYSGGFLNNKYPAPPELESETQILLAVIKVTQAGLVDESHGNYCTGGVADLRLFVSSKLSVTGGDSHDSLHASAFAAASHATQHKSGGADAIKIDELAAPTDVTTLNASTSAHGLMPKYPNTSAARVLKEDGTWLQRVFDVGYPFGDGSAVLVGQSLGFEFPLACKIVRARIRSQDANGDLLSGSVTATFYVHDYNVDADSVSSSGSIALSSASSNSETEDITVAADKMVTVRLSGITTCKQVIVSFKIEAT